MQDNFSHSNAVKKSMNLWCYFQEYLSKHWDHCLWNSCFFANENFDRSNNDNYVY